MSTYTEIKQIVNSKPGNYKAVIMYVDTTLNQIDNYDYEAVSAFTNEELKSKIIDQLFAYATQAITGCRFHTIGMRAEFNEKKTKSMKIQQLLDIFMSVVKRWKYQGFEITIIECSK